MSDSPLMLGALPASAKAVPLTPDQDAAWSSYFRGFADQIDLANDQARGWYDTLRQVLTDTGQPLFQAAQMRDGMPIAWTKELDQQFLDVSAMAEQVAVWLREVADGKRAAILQGDDWGIESLPGDPFHIAMDPTNNLPVMIANGQVVHETEGGDVGAVGAVPWVIVGIGIVAGVAVTAIKGYVLYHLITGIRSVLESIAAYQQSKVWAQCVQTAQDPASCTNAIKALEDLQKAQNEGKSKMADDLRAFAEVAKWTVAGLVVLVGGYLAIEFVPPLLAERKHTRAAAGA